MTITTYKWSIKKWHELVDSGVLTDKSVELLNGEIVQMSPEREEHSYTNDDVAEYLREKLRGLAKVRESHPITLDNSEPEPDIALVQLPKTIYRDRHPYPQDIYWLIEISNKTLAVDSKVKSKIYARNSIKEYWIIDLVNNKLIVHTQPQKDDYTQVKELASGTIAPQAFPQISISLDRLLLFK